LIVHVAEVIGGLGELGPTIVTVTDVSVHPPYEINWNRHVISSKHEVDLLMSTRIRGLP
jgi:hypothetical protein